MMRFGMPTLIENRTLEDNVNLCSSLGLDFIELNMIDLSDRLALAKTGNAGCVLETKTIEALKKSVKWLNDHKGEF